ncbi:hypothetical protein BKA62DRAFT_716838 [Auriculariales sp. MPI-PUGE-AT-0066]|nr:hypothetical protein BKA62DRAFT_716838 [Auriculariales sp. MPI-PUGE-AT-0066]
MGKGKGNNKTRAKEPSPEPEPVPEVPAPAPNGFDDLLSNPAEPAHVQVDEGGAPNGFDFDGLGGGEHGDGHEQEQQRYDEEQDLKNWGTMPTPNARARVLDWQARDRPDHGDGWHPMPEHDHNRPSSPFDQNAYANAENIEDLYDEEGHLELPRGRGRGSRSSSRSRSRSRSTARSKPRSRDPSPTSPSVVMVPRNPTPPPLPETEKAAAEAAARHIPPPAPTPPPQPPVNNGWASADANKTKSKAGAVERASSPTPPPAPAPPPAKQGWVPSWGRSAPSPIPEESPRAMSPSAVPTPYATKQGWGMFSKPSTPAPAIHTPARAVSPLASPPRPVPAKSAWGSTATKPTARGRPSLRRRKSTSPSRRQRHPPEAASEQHFGQSCYSIGDVCKARTTVQHDQTCLLVRFDTKPYCNNARAHTRTCGCSQTRASIKRSEALLISIAQTRRSCDHACAPPHRRHARPSPRSRADERIPPNWTSTRPPLETLESSTTVDTTRTGRSAMSLAEKSRRAEEREAARAEKGEKKRKSKAAPVLLCQCSWCSA